MENQPRENQSMHIKLNQDFMSFYKEIPLFSAGYRKIAALLNSGADLLPPFILRLILAYEFWDAGFMKLNSEGWFDQLKFPYPFNLISDDNLWIMSTWLEIAGAIGLLLGLGTRFFTVALMVLTVVAIQTVHWPIEWHTLTDLSKGLSSRIKVSGILSCLLYLLCSCRYWRSWKIEHGCY
jgi:putative oxidoreductase